MSNYFDDPRILREIIMDNYQYPQNHGLTDAPGYLSKHMASDSCIDDITVQMKLENNIIQDLRFDGVGCTISTASTSIMTELLIGKTKEEAQSIIEMYNNMIYEKDYDEQVLREAIAFKNVSKQANRIKCATIGWNAVSQMLEESEANHE